jgi:NADH-quinone oxidoreductase subunit L
VLDHLYLIPLLPLVGLLVNLALGARLGHRGVGLVGCAAIGAAFVVTALDLAALARLPEAARHVTQTAWTWMQAGGFRADVAFLLDPLSAVMCLVVTFVGFLIHVYSVGYMHGDSGYRRYFIALNLFTFSMLTLVLADNFVLMFVGWEGVGLCSYLLIGHWFERHSAAHAARKAFVVNRIGDFGFLLGIFLMATSLGTVNFHEVFAAAPERWAVGGALATATALLLFLGATGKSAQIPLYVWLPDAMEGPTPVSALIHAATMVTAGVYMVARCHALFELAPAALVTVAVIGAATALFAATIGLVQRDIKRVLAYSTVSQLGYMFLACGVGAYSAGIFHLATHAFFKALLFLGAGSVIHALSGEQDLRRMGGLKGRLPWTHGTMLIACLAIAGIPPFAGFFSKDAILAAAFAGPLRWLYYVGLLTAGLTAFYMFRLLYLTFYGGSRVTEEAEHHLHESPPAMLVPLAVLAVGSALVGFLGIPLLPGADRFGDFLKPVFADLGHLRELAAAAAAGHASATAAVGHAAAAGAHGAAAPGAHHASVGLEVALMAVSVAAGLVGIFVARRLYLLEPGVAQRLAERFQRAYRTLLDKYYVDELYGALVVRPLERLSGWLWRVFDVRVIDGAVDGTGGLVVLGGTILRLFQNGYVGTYAFFLVLGVVILFVSLGGAR